MLHCAAYCNICCELVPLHEGGGYCKLSAKGNYYVNTRSQDSENSASVFEV